MSRQIIEERLIKIGIDNEQFKKGLTESLSSLNKLDDALSKSGNDNKYSNAEKSVKSFSKAISELMSDAPKIGNIFFGMFDKIGASVGKTASTIGNLASGIIKFISPLSGNTREVSQSFEGMNASVQNTGKHFGFLQSIASVALGNIAASAIQTGLSITTNLGRSILNTIAPLKQGFGQFEDKINSVNMLVAALGRAEMPNITSSLDELQKYAETTKYSVKQMHNSLSQFVNAGVGLKESTTALKGWGNLAASAGATTDGFNRSLQFGVQQALQMGKMNTQNWVSVENAGLATQKFKDILVQTAEAMGINVDMSEGFRNSLSDGWLTNEVLIKSLETLANDETLSKMAAEFHTFGEVADAVSDQVTSSWARFWETLIGTAGSEEVTAFWTKWGNIASDVLSKTGEKATEFAKTFVDLGGRAKILELMETSFNSIGLVFKPLGDAFKNVFGDDTSVRLGEKLVSLIQTLSNKFKIGASESEAFRRIFEALFTSIKWIFAELGAKLKLVELLIPDHLFKNIVMLVGLLASAFTSVIRTIEVVFSKFINFEKLGGVFNSLSNAVHGFWDNIHEGISKFTTYWGDVFESIPDGVGKAIDWLKKLWDVIKLLTPAIGEFKRSFREVFHNFTHPFESLSSALSDNSRGFNEWLFFVGNAFKRFPFFGKQLGELLVGFSHFNDATYNMSSLAGRFGDRLRRNLVKISTDWTSFSSHIASNYKTFWVQFNTNMDKVLNGQIKSWKEFSSNLNWGSLIPKGLINIFSGLKFNLPDFKSIFGGLLLFATNPFETLIKGSAGFSKWLENTTFSFKFFGDIVRKHWPSLDAYALKLDKIKISFSFLKPIVDSLGKAIEWLQSKFNNFSIGKFNFSGLSSSIGNIKDSLKLNFADGIVPGIVKSIDAFGKWQASLASVKFVYQSLADVKNVVAEMVSNVANRLDQSKVDFTNYKTTFKTFGGWFQAFWKGIVDTANAPALSNIFGRVKNIFQSIIDWVSSTFGPRFKQFFGSLPEDVQKSLSSIWSALKQFFSEFASNFKEADFSFKNFGEAFEKVGSFMGKTIKKLTDLFKDFWKVFKELFSVSKVSADELSPNDFGANNMRTAEAGMDNLSESVDRLHNKTTGIMSTIGDMTKLLSEMFRGALEPFAKEDSAALDRVFTLAASILVLWNTRKRVIGMKDVFGDFFKTLTNGPKNVFGSLSTMFTSISTFFKSKTRFENIKALALGIGTLAASLWLLSTIPGDKLLIGIGGLAATLAVFEIFYLTLSKTTKSFNPAKVRNMQQAMYGMVGLSGSILLLSSSVAMLGKMDTRQAIQGIVGVGLLLAAIFTSMGIMNRLQGNTIRGVQKISVSLLTFVGIAHAIRKIVPALDELGKMNFGTMMQGILGVGIIFTGLTALTIAASKLNGTKLASVFTFTAMASAVKKIAESIRTLGDLDVEVLKKGELAVTAILGVVSLMVYAFSKLGSNTQSFSKNAFVMFAGLAILFKMMSELAHTVSGMPNPDVFSNAVLSIGIIMGAFGLMAAMMGYNARSGDDMENGIKRLGFIALELVVASTGLLILSKMNSDLGKVSIAVITLGVVMAGFVALSMWASRIDQKGFIGLGVVAASLVASAIGMKILTSVPVDNILAQVLGMVAVLGALAFLGKLTATPVAIVGIAVLAAGFLALAFGVKIANDAIAGVVNAFGNLIRAITDLINTTTQLGAEGGARVAAFFKEMAKGGNDIARVMASVATGAVKGFLQGISENMDTIVDIGGRLILGLVQGILNAATNIAEALITVLGEAIIQLAEALPGWITKLCDALLQGMTQVAQWIRNNKNILVTAFIDMLEALNEVVVEGFRILVKSMLGAMENLPIIGDKVKELAPQVDAAFKGLNKAMRSGLDEFKDYPSIATEDGINKAIATMDALGPKEAEAARRFAASGKDGLDVFRIYCSQLGIQGPQEFIKGLQNGSISAKEAGRLLAKMVELGMSETQVKSIAEAAGFDYANGILTAKPKALENSQDIKKTVEEGLTGGGAGFNTDLISSAFAKLNEHFGGQLDITKALVGVETGEINQEMLDKLASGDFEGISQANMDNFLKPIEGMGDKAAGAVDDANGKIGEGMDRLTGNLDTKTANTSATINNNLSNFGTAIAGAVTGMSNYTATIEANKGKSEQAAKGVADVSNNGLKFDPTAIANNSMGIYASTLGSEANKGKVRNSALQVNATAKSGMGDTSGAAASGEAITLAFASGLVSSVGMSAISSAMNAINNHVRAHQPHSPAKVGVFSGLGWNKVKTSGIAIVKEFASGLGSVASLDSIDRNMNKVHSFVHKAMDTLTAYLDDNMDLNPTITPVLDTSKINGYLWNGAGLLNLEGNNIDYSSLNPNTSIGRNNQYKSDVIAKKLDNLNNKLDTLAEYTSVGNDLLAKDRFSPVYMDKDMVNRALAPGMSEAQRVYADKINMLDGVLPNIT